DVSLAERNPVCYTPSASVMRYCRAKRRPDSGRSLVFADSRATRPLSHARDQAFAIAARYGAELHTGAATTRDLVEKRLTGEHLDVLHFACHGEFDQADPMRSGVLLAGDDRLTAADLLRLPVNANLVTLRACATGHAALADYEHLPAASSPDAPTATATSPEPAEPPAGSSAGTAAGSSSRYTALARAAARCRTVLRTGGGATPDYGRQPFVHPYYWA